MSFVAELKHRKVVRVAIAYLVAAWVAIQAASIALPAFDAPLWALRVLILIFALGFPLALLLTWALELTPEGIRMATGKVGNKRIAAICAGLVALALGWYFLGQPALRRGATAVPERSIAVMPFVNLSGDPKNEYFSDGLAETTLDMLAQVHDLKVIARTSSFAFKGKATDTREIGRVLGAATLLEGSVQQAGGTVRITVQLIRAADGSHLWSRHFDRRIADVFPIQDEIATEVVKALQIALPAPEQRRLLQKRTDNVAAYREYLEGIALLPNRKVSEMRRAAQHFERAIQLDPDYARAYIAANNTYSLLDQYGGSISNAERTRADRYLQHALVLAPSLGEARIAHAAALERAPHPDLPGAEAEYKLGLQLSPGYATGYQWYGQFLATRYGRYDEALPLLRKAAALDPLSPVIRDVLILHLGQIGRVDEAIAMSDAEFAHQPAIPRYYLTRVKLFEQKGDLVGALRSLQQLQTAYPDSLGVLAARCSILLDFGATDEARRCTAATRAGSVREEFATDAAIRLALIARDPGAALALAKAELGMGAEQPQPADLELLEAYLKWEAGQPDEALTIYRRLKPAWFVAGKTPTVYPGEASDALIAGVLLIRSGAPAQGRALLAALIGALAGRPYGAMDGGRSWLVALAYAQLGQTDRAFAEMQAAVGAGYFLGLPDLDAEPLAAGLRSDPRYLRILAPARTLAAGQCDKARAAALLWLAAP